MIENLSANPPDTHPAVAALEEWLGPDRLADPETARLVGVLREVTAVASLVDRIVALIPDAPSNRISDWPADEQEYARSGDWNSFSDREVGLNRLRKTKLARRIVAELGLDGSAPS